MPCRERPPAAHGEGATAHQAYPSHHHGIIDGLAEALLDFWQALDLCLPVPGQPQTRGRSVQPQSRAMASDGAHPTRSLMIEYARELVELHGVTLLRA
jgi:hypothetical protein